MKWTTVTTGVIFGVLSSLASGVHVFDSDYVVETYVTYPHSTQTSKGMASDSSGNLYVTYEAGGTIDRVSPDKTVTTIATGLLAPRDIVWTGGTAYGNYLYVADHAGIGFGKIARVNPTGGYTKFVDIRSPQGIGIDRWGNYGGYLYTGPRVNDHVDRLLPNGTLERFCDFPYGAPGGPTHFAFDPGTLYGGLMYVTVDGNNEWRGLHSVDTDGNHLHFAPGLSDTEYLAFDATGQFGHKLFVLGKAEASAPWRIWQVDPDGSISQFAVGTISEFNAWTFGGDGSLYIHEVADGLVTISRITLIPEPSMIVLLGIGSLPAFVRRRK